jgi:myo-inositol-1(or 4)-monophosphatase
MTDGAVREPVRVSRDESDGEVAVAAARAGAEVVRALYGRRLARIDKGGGDFATEADVAAEEAIRRVLRTARPDDAVLGEEGGRQAAARPGSGREWLVDPLCGTVNYAAGTMAVAVNVALPGRAAAVADPFSGEVFHSDGGSAWLRSAEGTDSPLAPTAATALVDVNLDPPFPSAPAFRPTDLLAHPGFIAVFRPRVVSSTLALAWVAAGRRAAYVTDGGEFAGSVHFAAGLALCRAAGCVVTGIDGRPLGPGRGRGIVAAADAETHARLLALVGEV